MLESVAPVTVSTSSDCEEMMSSAMLSSAYRPTPGDSKLLLVSMLAMACSVKVTTTSNGALWPVTRAV